MPSRKRRSKAGPFDAVHVHRVDVGNRLSADGQPALHHADLVGLRDRDPLPQFPHRVAARSRREQFRHVDGLLMVTDHALHELDVGGRGPHTTEVDRRRGSNDATGLARRARLDDWRPIAHAARPAGETCRGGHRHNADPSRGSSSGPSRDLRVS
jgi:hypothetical protein